MTAERISSEHMDLLREGLAELAVPVSSGTLSLFRTFLEELLLWNSKTNLVGTDDPARLITGHVLDSLAVHRLLKNENRSILDVGAGAGFPSIPLCIANPGLNMYAAERRRKRAAFLRNAAVILRLSRYTVIERDVRHITGCFGVVLARAVAELAALYRGVSGMTEENGVIIAFKGKSDQIHRELEQLKDLRSRDRDIRFRVERVNVPHCRDERNIVIIETG